MPFFLFIVVQNPHYLKLTGWMLVAIHKEGTTISRTNQEGTAMLSISTTLFTFGINQLPGDARKQDEEGTQQNEEHDETDRK